ncbi:MAG TPA: exodeoxyribonuclease VII small subunit [Acidimicrobiia bacterium]
MSTPPEELAYRDALDELDGIVAELEADDVDVDVVAERLERAANLVTELQRRIHDAQLRVEQLAPRFERTNDDDRAPDDDRDPGGRDPGGRDPGDRDPGDRDPGDEGT